MAKLLTPMRLDCKDNISFNMLLTKDELWHHEANLWQAGHITTKSTVAGLLSKELEGPQNDELGKENALLKTQLLEVVADNDALSKSLQERAKSLADMTDGKLQAESEAKVLQVQIKAMQKDMDAHKYELHLLRKQLQIKNAESEQNKSASDASHKQHLDNVMKIARLESDCQRLRSLIRQRLPGPATIAQMRAETEFHIKKQKVSSASGNNTSRSLPNMKSSEQYEREKQALKDRLSSVEDEANFLKEALVKKTAELQEARQLCARTAMKLSSAQNLLEAMSMPPPLEDDNKSMPRSTHSVYEGCTFYNCAGGNNNIDDGDEDREIICAETWASALVAELSYLSCGQGKNDLCLSRTHKHTHDASRSDHEELSLQSALQEVSQKLSSVGNSLVLSGLQPTERDADEAMSARNRVKGEVNFDGILQEVSQVKRLLLELGRAMELQDELRERRTKAAAADSSSSLTTEDNEKCDGISMIWVTDNVNHGALIDSNAENSSLAKIVARDIASELVGACKDEDTVTDKAHVEELESLLGAAQAEVEASRGRISALEAALQQAFEERDDASKMLSDTCTLKDNLEAELAKALAEIQDLELQTSSRKSELSSAVEEAGMCQHHHSSNNVPTKILSRERIPIQVCDQSMSTNWDSFCIAKEGEEIAVARAQLAYCLHRIGMLTTNFKMDVQSQLLQDVIKEKELPSLDMTSSSSKSMDEKSTLSSPTSTQDDTDFGSPSFNHTRNSQPKEHHLLYAQSSEYNIDTLKEKTRDSSHDDQITPSNIIPIDHVQAHEETKQYNWTIMSTPKSKTIDSIGKDNVFTPPIKSNKLSTTKRIVDFFNMAKMNGGNP